MKILIAVVAVTAKYNLCDVNFLGLDKIVHNRRCSHHRGLVIVEPGITGSRLFIEALVTMGAC